VRAVEEAPHAWLPSPAHVLAASAAVVADYDDDGGAAAAAIPVAVVPVATAAAAALCYRTPPGAHSMQSTPRCRPTRHVWAVS